MTHASVKVSKIISGYVHEIQDHVIKCKYHCIPNGVTDLIISYFPNTDSFNSVAKGIRFLNKKHHNSIQNSTMKSRSALGSFIIDPTINPAIYTWRFRFNLNETFIGHVPRVAVGIIECDDNKIDITQSIYVSSSKSKPRYYALLQGRYCGTMESNDTSTHKQQNVFFQTMYTNAIDNSLTMILNCKRKWITYYVNDLDSFHWKNIDMTKKYRLGVSLSSASVKIIDFQLEKQH